MRPSWLVLLLVLYLLSLKPAFAATGSYEIPPFETKVLFIFLKVGEKVDVNFAAEGGSLNVFTEDGNGNPITTYNNATNMQFTLSPSSMDGDFKIIMNNISIETSRVDISYTLTPKDHNREFVVNPSGEFAVSSSMMLIYTLIGLGGALFSVVAYERIKRAR